NPSKLFLTPQKSIQIQNHLPSHIIIAFHQSPPIPSQYQYLKNSIQTTTPSAQTSLKPHPPPQQQSLFRIIQAPQYNHLPQQTPKHLVQLHFPPYPIPPLSVRQPNPLIYHILQHTQQFIPKHKPTYLIGL
ncbi:tRNA-guanine transglycosylase, partial [Staphylococcus pasteuri]|uniref:tRNA-guanine transglycosylase n=1 Tax=Staphylococcus pasteuri TaxID=45972 RepID=UPI0012B6B875